MDLARLLRDVPEDWRKAHVATLMGTKFVVLQKEVPRSAGGKPRVLKRVFWPADLPIPKPYEDWANRGTWELREHRGKTHLWRDYTPEERMQMGEILDARYNISKTFIQAANDLSTGAFFKRISQNPAWTWSGGGKPEGRVLDNASLDRLYVEYDWVKMPDSTIEGTRVKRYGALAGRYVRAAIARDLLELERILDRSAWDEILSQWKLNKTTRNPVVHVNNVMSNFVLMDLEDVRVEDVVTAIRAMAGKNADYEAALKAGVFGTGFVAEEIRDGQMKALLGSVLSEGLSKRGIVNWMKGHPITAKAAVLGHVAEWVLKLDQLGKDAYQMEDDLFRLAYFIRHRRDLGDDEAAGRSRDAFLNYDIRAPWINSLRRSVLPFISYTYRFIPKLADAMANKPWKVAKIMSLIWIASQLGHMGAGDDDEDKAEQRGLMADDQNARLWGLGPYLFIRLPWNGGEDDSDPVYLDARRWAPGGDIFDQGRNPLGLPSWLMPGGPLMLAAELVLNKSAFTDAEIFTASMSASEKADTWLSYAWRSFGPAAAAVPGSYYWDKIQASLMGELDFQREALSLPDALASSVGLKFKTLPSDLQRDFRELDLKRQQELLRERARRYVKDLDRNRITEDQYDRLMDQVGVEMDRVNAKAEALPELR